jgi:hypothetical protein
LKWFKGTGKEFHTKSWRQVSRISRHPALIEWCDSDDRDANTNTDNDNNTNTTSTDDDSTANHTNTNDESSDAAKGNNANGADNSHSIGGGDCEKNNPSSDDGDNTSSEVNGSWKALRFTMSRQVLLLNRIVRIPTLRTRKPMKIPQAQLGPLGWILVT